jgi:uncharacterized protein
MTAPRRSFFRWTASLSLLALGLPRLAWAQTIPAGHRTLQWEELIPKGWDSSSYFKQDKIDPRNIQEGSAEEAALWKKMREIWDNAPLRRELAGTKVRIPGYVVPLESSRGTVREFLLVPYFGACVHSPPPPANQMVLVRLDKPATLKSMDVIWAWGDLDVVRHNSEWGVSGYLLKARGTVPYQETRPR